ncbi:uncharacterized protein LOC111702696 [Eurytemora carolleeae]|uniref:uncharacterized protein LOC111702696 n=1 Tax=Eurytemora carolleeae TaxID=1294199 RepID=UPI000C7818D6|nr:uncharacterized protein LOC111702696 [Eurytemora carolleeae]|eukprot:XP_023330230.1 uncharacterized protein LOC111702696 [Eurytemora affinis]
MVARYSLIFCLLLKLCATEQMKQNLSSRTRRGINKHYSDDHCLNHFSVESSTIIRTKDSRENGAVFINETEVETMSRCLHLCCSTPLCNVAVFGEVNSCYLFDCGSPEAFKCQFTGSDDFSSAVLEIDRHRFDLSAADKQRDHSDQLSQLRNPKPDNQDQVEPSPIIQDDCGQWQFSCNSGDCIAIYDVCNNIPQCRDGSDEDPGFCKTQTTTIPTTTNMLIARQDSLQGFQGVNQGIPVPKYPYLPQYQNPFRLYNHYPSQFNYQQQFQQEMTTTIMPTVKETVTEKSTTLKKLRIYSTTPTNLPEVESYEEKLIKELGDKLTPLGIPGIAIFTLTVGIMLTTFIFVVVICRIHRGRISFRRNLTHEADGDFLVNGMYL